MAQSKKPEFQKDPGWDGLDEQQLFSESEYESYLKQKELERHLTYDVQNSVKIFFNTIINVQPKFI